MQGKRNEILASCYWWIYSRTRAVKGNWLQRLFGRAVARAFESACRWDLPAAPREKEVASAQGEIYCRGDPRCRGSSQASRDRICPPVRPSCAFTQSGGSSADGDGLYSAFLPNGGCETWRLIACASQRAVNSCCLLPRCLLHCEGV